MRTIICWLMLISLTACGESKTPKPAAMSVTAAIPVSATAARPTLGVTYSAMMANIETEMLLQKTGYLSDKTPKYFFESRNGSVIMNLIGQKSDLDRAVYMIPMNYPDASKIFIDLGVIVEGMEAAVPDCKDCIEWLKSAIGGANNNMKIVGSKRITHENLSFAHMIVISNKESPMVIEDNPK